jgi:hypothetical protein
MVIRAFAQRVEVADDAVYLKENKNVLLRMLIAKKEGTTAGIGAPGFVPKWRIAWDSNIYAEIIGWRSATP